LGENKILFSFGMRTIHCPQSARFLCEKGLTKRFSFLAWGQFRGQILLSVYWLSVYWQQNCPRSVQGLVFYGLSKYFVAMMFLAQLWRKVGAFIVLVARAHYAQYLLHSSCECCLCEILVHRASIPLWLRVTALGFIAWMMVLANCRSSTK